MKRILLSLFIILLTTSLFAVEYEMVMFKCGKKYYVDVPNVSQTLEKECHSAFMAYDEQYAYVFAIIDVSKNITWLAITNFLMPLSKEDELKYTNTIALASQELEYVNGVKPRPTMDMTGALK